jgi:hypothetical protein
MVASKIVSSKAKLEASYLGQCSRVDHNAVVTSSLARASRLPPRASYCRTDIELPLNSVVGNRILQPDWRYETRGIVRYCNARYCTVLYCIVLYGKVWE